MLEDKILRDLTRYYSREPSSAKKSLFSLHRRDYIAWVESILLDSSEGIKKGEIYRPSALARSLLSDEVLVLRRIN